MHTEEYTRNPGERKLDTTLLNNLVNQTAPAGYTRIELSTNGCLRVPGFLHVRNFNTEDIMALSLRTPDTLPRTLENVLNGMIYEEEILAKDLHESEVVEILLKVYSAFFGTVLPNVPYPLGEEDWQFINSLSEEEREKLKDSLVSGEFVPRCDLNLQLLNYKALEVGTKTNVSVTNNGFKVTFRPPTFGDINTVKEYVETMYATQDAEYYRYYDFLKREREILQKDPTYMVDTVRVPMDIRKAIDELANEKLIVAAKVTKVLSVIRVNDEPLPSTEARMKLADDPRLDVRMLGTASEKLKSLEFGVDPELTVVSPITHKTVKRRFDFRLLDILSAILTRSGDEHAVDFDD